MNATISVSRIAPWAKDPSISSRGHETGPRAYLLNTTDAAIDAWIAANAPHSNPSIMPVTDDEERSYYYIDGKDGRGYRVEIYVQKRYPLCWGCRARTELGDAYCHQCGEQIPA